MRLIKHIEGDLTVGMLGFPMAIIAAVVSAVTVITLQNCHKKPEPPTAQEQVLAQDHANTERAFTALEEWQ